MRIILIRHGETTGDLEDRYGGDYNDHLSEEGQRQSRALALELKDKKIETLFVSPLARAQETMAALSSQLFCRMVPEAALKERNQYGILTGMTKAEAMEKHPELVELLKDKYNTIEGAESYEDFRKRVEAVFGRLVAQNPYATIALITHGGFFRVMFRDVLKKGELGNPIGDCAWVELEKKGEEFVIQDSKGVEFSFQ